MSSHLDDQKYYAAVIAFPENFQKNFNQTLHADQLKASLEALLKSKQDQMIRETYQTMKPDQILEVIKLIEQRRIEGLEYLKQPIQFEIQKNVDNYVENSGAQELKLTKQSKSKK